MERDPCQWQYGTMLREEFVQQESLDEFIERTVPWLLEPAYSLIFSAENVQPDDVLEEVVIKHWAPTLHPETNTAEFLYLAGFTDQQQREERLRNGYKFDDESGLIVWAIMVRDDKSLCKLWKGLPYQSPHEDERDKENVKVQVDFL